MMRRRALPAGAAHRRCAETPPAGGLLALLIIGARVGVDRFPDERELLVEGPALGATVCLREVEPDAHAA